MLGTGLAQLITLCVSPVLTRLYIPEDFGGLSLFTALVAIFGVVANGRMELAIPLPSDFTASKNIFRLAMIITLGFSAALCLLMFLTYGILINTPYAFSKWFLLIPLSVVFFGIQNAINYWLTRNTKFKLQSQSKIILSLVSALTSVGLGFAGMCALTGLTISLAQDRYKAMSAVLAGSAAVASAALPLKLNILLGISVAVALCLWIAPRPVAQGRS